MPLPRFIRWAITALFPSGSDPWSATPTKVEPPYVFYTPGVPGAAQVDNYLLGGVAEVANLIATVPLGALSPVLPVATVTGSTSTALDTMAYDESGGIWLAAGHTADALFASPDNGLTWNGVATPASQVNAIGFFSSPGDFTPNDAILLLGGATNVYFYSGGSGSLINSGSTQGVTFNGGGVAFGLPTATLATFGFAWDSTDHRSRAFACTGSASYTALTLPTSWQNGPQTNIHYFTYATGPSLDAIVAWGGATPGSDTSYILHMSAAAFPTTPTFTALSLPAGMSGNAIVGVAYNATSELWGAMVWNGTQSSLWTTADLTTWTQQTPFLSGTGQCGGLISIGPYWVTTAKRGGVPGATSYTPIYSLDGVTWMRGAGTLIGSLPKLAAGKGCLALWDVNDAMVSAVRVG